jgi:D-lactate dehydrogenase (cytochrome)
MLIKTNADEIQSWLNDASNISGGVAERVLLPAQVEEVAEALAEATRKGTPVTVAGAGTGITGGRVPMGGIVLAMDRMATIKEVHAEPGNSFARVQPGVVLADLQKAVAVEGLLYPPDPTEWSCQIGGTVATNASGARSFKYGATRAYVQWLQIVLPTGDIVELRRGEIFADPGGQLRLPIKSGRTLAVQLPNYQMPAIRKHVAGYFVQPLMDAVDLFIGSEGTLGVITEIELRLLPQPAGTMAGVVFFDTEADLIAFVDAARAKSYATRAGMGPGMDARALEYFDAESLAFLRPHHPRVPVEVAGAIYFEQEITPETEDELMQAWLDLLERHNALLDSSWFATNERDRQELREFRHHLPVLVNEWIARHRQRKVSTDMAVPDAAFPQMLSFYQESLRGAGLSYVIFGHIGDNHVHVNILPKDDAEAARARAMYATFVERAVALGGTVSAEHGIGKLKRPYLAMLYNPSALQEMRSLKRALDPAMILGRGNLFPNDE